MFWCEKENRWCSVWSCDRKECEFVVRASDKERFYQCLTCQQSEARKILNLATRLDLEEQGRLIKLPCKEAYTKSVDIVYLIYDDEVVECTHCGLGINPVDGKVYITLATDLQCN